MLWVHTNETSIVPIEAIGDRRMHTDPDRVGKIQWMPDNPKRKAPQNGWSCHDGRVLHIACNISLLLCYSHSTFKTFESEEKSNIGIHQNQELPLRKKVHSFSQRAKTQNRYCSPHHLCHKQHAML